jgi:hypothetical protein
MAETSPVFRAIITAVDKATAVMDRTAGAGSVDVNVTFNGTPPGTEVTAKGSGVTSEPQTDVGYAFPGMAYAH